MNNIYEQIARKREEMSKTQKKIADYILAHQVAASFHTVGRLAKETGVSEASVVRFANFLGFDGYTSFQKQMQEKTQNQMDTPQRLALSYSVYEGREEGVAQVFKDDIQNLSDTLQGLDMDMFFAIVHELIKAKRIFIVCSRSSVGLGLFFQYYLSKRKCKVASLTDFLTSPLIRCSDYYLLAKANMSTYLDSYVAPQAIIDVLLMAIGKEKNKELECHFQEMEEVWHDLDVFTE